jgi:hypothetical protein
MSTIYNTHDNGGRPFKVIIDNNTVEIHKQISGDPDVYDPILIYHPEKVFVGKSPLNSMTQYSGGYGDAYDGNAILLKMPHDSYIFIGSVIFSFYAIAPITDLISPVGNSDVPYPYAIDSNNNYYMLIENVIIKNVPKEFKDDAYTYYYNNINITHNIGFDIAPKNSNMYDADKWFIGKNQYTMSYTPNPAEDYDRHNKKMYITKKNDKKKYELTKEDYIKLMEDYGDKLGFRRLETTMIHERLL